jgi:hypothetical protein
LSSAFCRGDTTVGWPRMSLIFVSRHSPASCCLSGRPALASVTAS